MGLAEDERWIGDLTKYRRQQDVKVSSARTNTHVAGPSRWERRNGGTSVGYSEGAALRMEQGGMPAESRHSLISSDGRYEAIDL
jgi:hypothetical protein